MDPGSDLAAKLRSWEGAWPDIITTISAHNDQGSMKRTEKWFPEKNVNKRGEGGQAMIT